MWRIKLYDDKRYGELLRNDELISVIDFTNNDKCLSIKIDNDIIEVIRHTMNIVLKVNNEEIAYKLEI